MIQEMCIMIVCLSQMVQVSDSPDIIWSNEDWKSDWCYLGETWWWYHTQHFIKGFLYADREDSNSFCVNEKMMELPNLCNSNVKEREKGAQTISSLIVRWVIFASVLGFFGVLLHFSWGFHEFLVLIDIFWSTCIVPFLLLD